ncbi:MAG TPA: transcription antitermination factor NusB [Anaerolineae bacterium]|nr:transcription antitermination factor NusB [Anaerolineae bacterium]
MKERRRARAVALQALYELDTTPHEPGAVLTQRFLEAGLKPDGEAFARELVTGVLQNRARLDALIQQHAPEWPIDQLAVIDRNVLRIAIYEFTLAQITPTRVAINEAIELAKQYGSDSASRFVNGVLGALASSPGASPVDSKATQKKHG